MGTPGTGQRPSKGPAGAQAQQGRPGSSWGCVVPECGSGRVSSSCPARADLGPPLPGLKPMSIMASVPDRGSEASFQRRPSSRPPAGVHWPARQSPD